MDKHSSYCILDDKYHVDADIFCYLHNTVKHLHTARALSVCNNYIYSYIYRFSCITVSWTKISATMLNIRFILYPDVHMFCYLHIQPNGEPLMQRDVTFSYSKYAPWIPTVMIKPSNGFTVQPYQVGEINLWLRIFPHT